MAAEGRRQHCALIGCVVVETVPGLANSHESMNPLVSWVLMTCTHNREEMVGERSTTTVYTSRQDSEIVAIILLTKIQCHV